MTMPEPLVSAEVDLKDFPFTPIFRARLFGSAFHANVTDAEWRAGVTLWLKSWDQVPAGTLPKEPIALCRLAELGRDIKTWAKIAAGALHGWFEASDGRLHHRVVAEGVNEAWSRKCAQRDRTAAARAARAEKRMSQSLSQNETASVTETETEDVTGSKGQRQGQGQGQLYSDADASGGSAPPKASDPIKDLWDRGLAIIGKDHRSLLGKMVKQYTQPVVLAAIVECENERPVDAAAYFVACCERRKSNGSRRSHAEQINDLGDWARRTDERESLRGDYEAAD